MNKNIQISIATILGSVSLYLVSYKIDRNQFEYLMGLVAVLFFVYLYLLKLAKEVKYFLPLIGIAFLFRLILLFAIPNLSDDYFRFLWDGELVKSGINPFVYLPSKTFAAIPSFQSESHQFLLNKMNSPNYYSVYPSVLQGVYFGAVAGSQSLLGSVISYRFLGIIAEIITTVFLLRILVFLKLPKSRIFIYLLNPMVIIEFIGNLHGEIFMICFTIMAVYYLFKDNFLLSTILLGLAVSCKMLPLIFMPLIVRKLGWGRGVLYGAVAGLVFVLGFAPFIDSMLIANIGNSVGLYFQKFEFNASLYYLLRWLGYQITGYNTIGILGKLLPIMSLIAITYIAFFKKITNDFDFLNRISRSLLVYYLCSLIVHPWYIGFFIPFAVISNQKFGLAWSFFAFFSYATYSHSPTQENLWLIGLEYLCLMATLIYDLRFSSQSTFSNQ
jgi:alpha-1,6-mannosyltransferase